MLERPTVMADLLESGIGLAIYCAIPSCYRKVHWSPATAVQRLGRGALFDQAHRRLRCSSCGALGRHGHVTVQADPEDSDEAHSRWLASSNPGRYAGQHLDAALELIRRRRETYDDRA